MKWSPDSAGSRKFYGVAIFIILMGVGTLCTGVLQVILAPVFGNWSNPQEMILGGLIVIALGYIVLELELLRQGVKK
jgi:uncharacterized membrane protein HdeD (DUF308 family)